MICPTCSAPLTEGALFCGNCGRAITSADLAAQRQAREEAAAVAAEMAAAEATAAAARTSAADAASPVDGGAGAASVAASGDDESPAWAAVAPPASAVPEGTPWWVADRAEPDVSTGADESAGADQSTGAGEAAPFLAATATSVSPSDDNDSVPDEGAPVAESSAADETPGSGADSGDVLPVGPTGPAAAAGAEPTPIAPEPSPAVLQSAPVEQGAAPVAPTAPAPLRPPSTLGGKGGRPSSVPLWTASLTPIIDVVPPAAGSKPNPDEAASAAAPEPAAERESRDGSVADRTTPKPATDTRPDDWPAPDGAGRDDATGPVSAEGPAPASVPTPDAAAGTSAQPDSEPAPEAAPRPGDTNVIPPLVVPAAAGTGALRCTVCGAVLSVDDLFCGECGTVVQSVVQSFTGPITPIPSPGSAPLAPAAAAPTSAGSPPSAEISAGGAETSDSPSRAASAVPSAASDVVAPVSQAAPAAAPGADPLAVAPSEAAPAVPAPREAPLAAMPLPPTGSPALPPFTPDPEPKPRRRGLFGRRKTATEKHVPWVPGDGGASATPPATATVSVPVPSAPEAAVPPARTTASDVPAGRPDDQPAAARTPAAPAVHVADVPAVADEGPEHPAPAPLAATPVDAPQQTAAPVAVPSLPPAPATPRQTQAQAWAIGSSIDDVEQTRIVPRKPLGEPFVLQFSTGESFTVQGTGLVGRAPTPQPGEAIDLLVRIVDPGKSVSKTHLEFGQDDGVLWVSDRWSGNGTIVRDPAQEARRCEPGTRAVVPRGARVDIGEQFFIVF